MSILPDDLLRYINKFTKEFFTMKITVETLEDIMQFGKVNVQIIETNETKKKERKE